MSDSLKAGVIGVGLVGAPHIEAIKRTGLADVVAVAAGSPESARRAAERHGVRRAVEDWRAIVEDPEIDVVHNCTPNHVHAEVGTAALAAGKHLITEKPLADTFEHAGALMSAAAQSPSVTALCHNYREYAMVAQARELIAEGAIGDVFQIHGVYLQDWLSDVGARNWRLNPEQSGPSTTFADIGTHWCDLAMHLVGRRIESVCAVTGSLHARTADDHSGCLLRFAGQAPRTACGSSWTARPGRSPGIRNDRRTCGSDAPRDRRSCCTNIPTSYTNGHARRHVCRRASSRAGTRLSSICSPRSTARSAAVRCRGMSASRRCPTGST
jgi:predicted dehydrogenase